MPTGLCERHDVHIPANQRRYTTEIQANEGKKGRKKERRMKEQAKKRRKTNPSMRKNVCDKKARKALRKLL